MATDRLRQSANGNC